MEASDFCSEAFFYVMIAARIPASDRDAHDMELDCTAVSDIDYDKKKNTLRKGVPKSEKESIFTVTVRQTTRQNHR